jgi:hypothetical protein
MEWIVAEDHADVKRGMSILKKRGDIPVSDTTDVSVLQPRLAMQAAS